ncbi:MAG: aromatic ring-opening dioxygenase subunit LigB, partial [Thermomicrobiales bacterium]|nr:aromatic ring-opening dioxygenase subunit LigB [Thermomicrobiales bacterium]
MAFVFAGMAPHGFPIIPELSEDAEGGLTTRAKMLEFGNRIQATNPDVIVVATPHGFRVDDFIMVSNAKRGAGFLNWEGKKVEQNVPFDQPFAQALADTARVAGAPVAMGSYAGGGVHGVMPLDWGVITPLWFAAYPRNMVGFGDVLADAPDDQGGPTVVVVCPARNLTAVQLIAFGRAMVDAAETDGRRIAYIASCDWAHRHSATGPYGFSEVAAPADARIVEAMKRADLGSLAAITPDEIQEAAMDGWPQ